jgi:hypothetical protein
VATHPSQDHLGFLLEDTTDRPPASAVMPVHDGGSGQPGSLPPCRLVERAVLYPRERHLHLSVSGDLPADLDVAVLVVAGDGSSRSYGPPRSAVEVLRFRRYADWYLPPGEPALVAVQLALTFTAGGAVAHRRVDVAFA